MENVSAEIAAPGTTGRYLVLLREDSVKEGVNALSKSLGLQVASAADFDEGAVDAQALESTPAMVFPALGVAVVDVPPDQMQQFGTMAAGESSILAVEPERIVFAFEEATALQTDYLLGYRDAINHLVDRAMGLNGSGSATAVAEPTERFADTADLTWGLQATRVAESQFTGKGVKVAILDTGFDLGHPDFAGRSVTAQSFIAGQQVQDGHGHGTHCIGTACGPRIPGQLPRYGVAYEADIFAGKVLSNAGSGSDSGILAGINWAITNGCSVISMSLGAATQPGQAFSQIFETVAKRALAAGTLIVAAAGNESSRPGIISPVGHPANCPSILSVGALDAQMQVAVFSCGGINPSGGQVDIAGPGVAIRSSWPRPLLYRTISGTSMATPHVAGIAALHKQANPDMSGGTLGWLLLQSARRLTLATRDIGAGLAQAPV
jgi:subtilisin family serine protease